MMILMEFIYFPFFLFTILYNIYTNIEKSVNIATFAQDCVTFSGIKYVTFDL